MTNEDISKRLLRLEAFEAVRQCVYSYALAGDRNNRPEIVDGLFTENATWEAAGFGKFEGRSDIVRGLGEIGRSTVIWAFHLPGGPLIRLADDLQSAKAFWWIWVPAKLRDGGAEKACWGAGTYNADMIFDTERWKFHRMLFEPKLQTPFEGPWTQVEGKFKWPE